MKHISKDLRRNTFFRSKYQLLFLGTFLLMTIYFISTLYYNSLEESKSKVLSQLKTTVCTAALNINGDSITALSNSYPFKDDIQGNSYSKNYEDIHNYLVDVQMINKLKSPIYIIDYCQDEGNFEFLVTSAVQPYWKHSYVKFPDKLLQEYHSGGTLQLHKSENGQWLSAFAPIVDSEDRTVAILMADQEFGAFIQDARAKLFRNIGISLGVFILIVALIFSFIRKDIQREERLKRMLRIQNKEIAEQNEELLVQKDNIDKQNEELSKANDIIRQKNMDLLRINNKLDQLVEQRTFDLRVARDNISLLLYRSSHDLLGPLSTIKGLIYLLNQNEDPDLIQTYIDKLEIEHNRLDRTVRCIDRIYHLENDKHEIDESSLSKIRESIMQDFNLENVQIEENYIPKGIKSLVSIDLIKLVIHELLENAKTFNEEGESVEIEFSEMQDQASITVKNKGKHIHEEVKSKMFEMFFRGSNLSKGAGLGLYISKIALSKLGAEIRYFNENNINHFQVIFKTADPIEPDFSFPIYQAQD